MPSFRIYFGSTPGSEPFEADDLRDAWCKTILATGGRESLDLALEAEGFGAEFPPTIKVVVKGKRGRHRVQVLPADAPAPQPKRRREA